MKKIIIFISLMMVLITLFITSCGTSTTTTAAAATTPAGTTVVKTPTTSAATTAAPSPTTSAAVTPKKGGKLVIVTGVLPDGIFGYPAKVVNGASTRISGHVMEGLFKMNVDSSLTPVLATSWTIADDKKSITFNLRKGVKFMDGTDFNADAVKWNFDTEIANKKVPNWASVDVIDEYTVRVNFVSYANTNLQDFAGMVGFIVSPTAYKTNGEEWMYTHVVSTAAFTISEFVRDVSVTMVRNDNYWQQGKPYLDAVEYQFIPDNDTAWAQVQTGKVDVWWTNAQYTATALKQNYEYVGKAGTTMCLIPDSANPDSPWSKLKVRQAAEYAIDRVAIAKAFGYGLAQAPYQIAPDVSPAYVSNLPGRVYDAAKAKQLLTEAGYPDGFDTQIICQIASNTNKDEVQAIQSYLGAVGIRATVNYYETAKYYEYRNGTWDNGLLFEPIASFANYNGTFNYYFGRKATVFFSLAKSDAFLAAFDASMASTYPEANLLQATSQAIYDDAMVIPTSQRITIWLLQPNSAIKDLGLETRHIDLFFNTEDAWFDK